MPQKTISLRIDGELVSAPEGQTILQAAKASGKYIPTLCALRGLQPVGACRLCIVEVAGHRSVVAGLHHSRPGRHVGHDQFTEVALYTGACQWNSCSSSAITSVRSAFRTAIANCSPWRPPWASVPCVSHTTTRNCGVDLSHPRFVLDHNRCILCTRCVRVCAELEGAHVWE